MVSRLIDYHERKVEMLDYLGNKCVKCGSCDNLEFDHVDHNNKSFTITQNWGRSWEILKEELDKCQLLCKNCHLEKSMNEGSLAKGINKQPNQVHGTVHSYNKYKCRCADCKAAKSQAMKDEYVKYKK